MIYSHDGYCVCGCEVWIEYIRKGNEWVPRFTDQEMNEIQHCPDCGKDLDEDDLASK